MNVVAMSFIEVYFYFLTSLAVVLAACSFWAPALAYINAVLLLAMLYLQIVSIPLQLNWSRSMYGSLLRREFFFVFFTAVIYAVHFYAGGVLAPDHQRVSFFDALYFSFTTWTTLGYGDIAASPLLRLATSLEALTGVLTISVLTATIWLYCQERLHAKPADSEGIAGMQLRSDRALGVWLEIESEQTRAEDQRRREILALRSCPNCGRAPSIVKFWELTGRVTPVRWFMVTCECGARSRPRRSAFAVEWEWNRQGPVRPEAAPGALYRVALKVLMFPAQVLYLARLLAGRLRRGSK